MKVNALLMDEKDNVVTCVEEVAAGQEIAYDKGGKICTLTAEDTIPYCHKAALDVLEPGQKVVKYGEQIGNADRCCYLLCIAGAEVCTG